MKIQNTHNNHEQEQRPTQIPRMQHQKTQTKKGTRRWQIIHAQTQQQKKQTNNAQENNTNKNNKHKTIKTKKTLANKNTGVTHKTLEQTRNKTNTR